MAKGSASAGKRERQQIVASLVQRKRIGTQFALIDALAKAGFHVTQATASRDIRELGLEKTEDALGRPRYVVPDRRRRDDPAAALASVVAQFGGRATAARNIVVVQSEIGSAPALARALDRLGHPLVVGTLAGDDTCLVICADSTGARNVAAELTGLMR